MNRLYPIPVLLAVALVSACDDDSTDPVVLEDCPAAVAVVVGSGLNPTFNWQPQCQLFFINVEPADAGNDLWTVVTSRKVMSCDSVVTWPISSIIALLLR